MADALEAMLARAADALGSTDQRIGEVRRLDDVLDRLNTAIKAYLSALDLEALSGRRTIAGCTQILMFATNLEAAGDVIDRDVMGHVAKRLKRGLPLTTDECAEAQPVAGPSGGHGARGRGRVHDRGCPRGAPACRREGSLPRLGGRRDTRRHFDGLRDGKAAGALTSICCAS